MALEVSDFLVFTGPTAPLGRQQPPVTSSTKMVLSVRRHSWPSTVIFIILAQNNKKMTGSIGQSSKGSIWNPYRPGASPPSSRHLAIKVRHQRLTQSLPVTK
ncbi:hypothetical protein E4U53_007199 [Claviceps sorghi]|nr:hypothetical protein E4U53_007199 [Claviceps sorghi]